MYGNTFRNLENPLDSPALISRLEFVMVKRLFGGVHCHEIENIVVFHVAAFGGLGSGPDERAEQHLALRLGLGSNHPEQPSRGKLADFNAWNPGAQRGAANSQHNATNAGHFSGNSGCIRANHPGNCA